MTPIIRRRAKTAYADDIMPSTGSSLLAALLVEQRELEARIPDDRASPQDTLRIGEAVLRFAAHEDDAFSALAPWLDPAALTELTGEHQRFSDDLELLGSLLRATPDSPDVFSLTASLLTRMRQHVTRDGRLLARAAAFADR
jgi:hypothetical protein